MRLLSGILSPIAFLILFTVLTNTQAKGEVFDDISYAIQSGNANELAAHFSNRIELTILDDEDVYSRRQAEVVVREFFEANRPDGFEIIHEGASNQKARYAIGYLESKDASFRTYLYVQEESGEVRIKELRFEKD